MDGDSPLSELERRLAAWAPSSAGLDTDAMLFAAGQAAARRPVRGRWVWPALAGCLLAVTGLLGHQLRREHAERLALELAAARMAARPLVTGSGPAVDAEPAGPSAGSSYLVARRAMEEGLDAWPTSLPAAGKSSPAPIVLRAGDTDVPDS